MTSSSGISARSGAGNVSILIVTGLHFMSMSADPAHALNLSNLSAHHDKSQQQWWQLLSVRCVFSEVLLVHAMI